MKPERASNYEKYYSALASLAEGILWVDEFGTVIYASDPFIHALGYSKEEVINKRIFDLEIQYNVQNYSFYWERLKTGEKISRATFFITSEDKLIPASIRLKLEGREKGALCLWLVHFQPFPIQGWELLNWCAGLNGTAAWQWDILKGTVIVNDIFHRIFHMPGQDHFVYRDNIISLLKDRLNNKQIAWLTNALRKLHQNRESIEKYLCVEWDGVKEVLLFRAEAVTVRGQVTQLRGTFQKFFPEQAGNEQEQLYRQTIQKMNDIVIWLRPDCGFNFVNQAALQQLGYKEEELLDEKTIMDIEVESTQKQWEKLWSQLKEEDLIHYQGSFQRKDGSVFPVDIDLIYLRLGKKRLVSLVARDRSQQRQEEVRLRRAFVEIDNLTRQLEAENIYLQEEVSARHNFENIISRSLHYKKVLNQIKKVAPTDSTVLIFGETGTGKELLARAVHRLSHRSERPLIKVDCSTLPKNLIESELFGHEKGAFTSAEKAKPGRFELADGGTLFLDEIGELPLELQPKLLRVLQEGAFTRLGSNDVITVDVRIITATNRDLEAQVKKGEFRSDLFYRINTFPIHNIPLRNRLEDIPLLAQHFLKIFNEKIGRQIQLISTRAMEKLMHYDYPGNVRELESIIERAVILSTGRELSLNHWNPRVQREEAAQSEDIAQSGDRGILGFEEMQRRHILKALELTNWKVSGEDGAASLLNLNPQTLYSKMRRLGVKRNK